MDRICSQRGSTSGPGPGRAAALRVAPRRLVEGDRVLDLLMVSHPGAAVSLEARR